MRLKNLLLLFLLSGCTRNVEIVKKAAPAVFAQAGFNVVGYEGYEWSPFGGGDVWFTLTRIPDNGIIYHAYVQKWFDEFHIYNIQAIDAVKP